MQRKKTKLKTLNLIATLLFIFAAVFYLVHEKYPFLRKQSKDIIIPVTAVNDGDTVSVTVNARQEKVRLIGIDAPELAQKPWGKESKKYLENLLSNSGWKVRLEYDIEQRDQYGRILAYLWTEDGTFINRIMIQSGNAMLYTVPPNIRHVDELKAAQKEAQDGRRGIWSPDGLKERPKDYRKKHPRQ